MKKHNVNSRQYRQGDVLIVPVDKIPKGFKKQKRCTLALGEVTGHHHTIFKGAVGYAPENEKTELSNFIEVKDEMAALTHQEHDTIEIPQGNYQVFIQSEYTPKEIRRVAD